MDGSIFTAVLVPVGLAVVMASLGLSLTVDDFRRIFVFPRGVLIGLGNLLLISPFLAFGVAELYGLGAVLAVGLVLLGASPGGTTANMLTHLARGDTALSVTMTAISSVAAVVTVPLFLGLAIEHFDAGGLGSDVDMGGVVARVFLITLVPLAIGIAIRHRRSDWVGRNGDLVRRVSLIAFVIVVLAAVVAESGELIDNFGSVAAAALTLNVLAMSVSFTIARLARLDDRQSTAIAMELGVHNATLAIAVATAVDDRLVIPAAVYSGFMFITAGLFARFMSRRNAAEPAPAVAEPAPVATPSAPRAAGAAPALASRAAWGLLTLLAASLTLATVVVTVIGFAG